jgi:hypothetical protein
VLRISCPLEDTAIKKRSVKKKAPFIICGFIVS